MPSSARNTQQQQAATWQQQRHTLAPRCPQPGEQQVRTWPPISQAHGHAALSWAVAHRTCWAGSAAVRLSVICATVQAEGNQRGALDTLAAASGWLNTWHRQRRWRAHTSNQISPWLCPGASTLEAAEAAERGGALRFTPAVSLYRSWMKGLVSVRAEETKDAGPGVSRMQARDAGPGLRE